MACAVIVAGCGQGAESPERTPAPAETTVVAPPPPPPPMPTYSGVFIRGPRVLRALRDTLGTAGFFEVLKVNRRDLDHVREGDSLVVPSIFGDTLALAPFPRMIEAGRDSSKLLLISLRVQAFAAYDSGRLVRWGPTSTGRKDKPTPPGIYHTNWKDQERYSTIDEAWLLKWYVNLQNFEGVSLHEYELPGRPVSHSCVRLLAEDAQWVYWWAEQWKLLPDGRTILWPGTPVVVFGEWNWHGRAPWRRLPADPHITDVTADEIATALREAKLPVFPVDSLRADSLRAVGRADALRAIARADSLRAAARADSLRAVGRTDSLPGPSPADTTRGTIQRE